MSGDVAIAHMICGLTLPSSYIASCGASDLLDESLTDLSHDWFTLSLNDKYSIILSCLDLWIMAAIGEIFRLAGKCCFMSSHLTIQQQPSVTLSSASVGRLEQPLGYLQMGVCLM